MGNYSINVISNLIMFEITKILSIAVTHSVHCDKKSVSFEFYFLSSIYRIFYDRNLKKVSEDRIIVFSN